MLCHASQLGKANNCYQDCSPFALLAAKLSVLTILTLSIELATRSTFLQQQKAPTTRLIGVPQPTAIPHVVQGIATWQDNLRVDLSPDWSLSTSMTQQPRHQRTSQTTLQEPTSITITIKRPRTSPTPSSYTQFRQKKKSTAWATEQQNSR